MNTRKDLETELRRLAAHHAPSPNDLRHQLDPVRRGGHRHRNTAWLAAAAAVVLVVGGIGVTAEMIQHGGGTNAASGGGTANGGTNNSANGAHASSDNHGDAAGSGAGNSGSVAASQASASTGKTSVPSQAASATSAADATGSGEAMGTALVAHHPETVTSPVTAQAPDGLKGQVWRETPTKLATMFFDRDAVRQRDQADANASDSAQSTKVREAGYVITADRDGQLSVSGSGDASAPTITRRPYSIAGHDATFDTAPPKTTDPFSFPASERLTWQLADGRWIHVWASKGESVASQSGDTSDDAQPSAALKTFAKSITEQPQTLPVGLTMGRTLPGFQTVSSMTSNALPGQQGNILYLCRDGFDPQGPDVQAGTELPCVMATVVPHAGDQDPNVELPPNTAVNADGLTVHVDRQRQHDEGGVVAWSEIAPGWAVQVTVPSSAKLSNDDMAALVASVQVSPNR